MSEDLFALDANGEPLVFTAHAKALEALERALADTMAAQEHAIALAQQAQAAAAAGQDAETLFAEALAAWSEVSRQEAVLARRRQEFQEVKRALDCLEVGMGMIEGQRARKRWREAGN